MPNILYIGYDLGDGETQLSFLSPDSKDPESKLMPTTATYGQPIMTAYGKRLGGNEFVLGNDLLGELAADINGYFANFKVKPTEAIKVLSEEVQKALLSCCKRGSTTEIRDLFIRHDSPEFIMPRCVREFTNALFCHEQITKGIAAFLDKCDEIAVLVGHPTKWIRDDIVLYRAMLEDSILGQGVFEHEGKKYPLLFNVEPESRAAFLYGRRRYAPTDDADAWNRSRYVLVIDVGSSTVDVSAMSGADPNNTHDDGHPYLGARLIDRAIYERYKTKLKEHGALQNFERSVRENPTLESIYILACRKGKEEYFSRAFAKLRVYTPLENVVPVDIRISKTEVEELLQTPVSKLDKSGRWYEGKSWQKEFECFLKKQKIALDENSKVIERIILTGGAARMGFVRQTCVEIFADVRVHEDVNPGIAISHGLALVGRSNEISAAFRRDAEVLLGNDLLNLVKAKVSKLGERLAGPIASIILDDIALHELRRWHSGSHRTLNDAMSAIEQRCSEENLKDRLQNDSAYKNAIHEWVRSDLIDTINAELGKLKDKHGLSSLRIQDVDITNVPIARELLHADINGGAIPRELLDPADAVAGNLALITGVVIYTVMPIILTVVVYVLITVVGAISATLASVIASILAAIPGAGWSILTVLGGVAAWKIVLDGWESMKETISNKMMSYNLPQWVRNLVSEEKFSSVLNDSRYEIIGKIESGIGAGSAPIEIANNVAVALTPLIEAKITEIRYLIESKPV